MSLLKIIRTSIICIKYKTDVTASTKKIVTIKSWRKDTDELYGPLIKTGKINKIRKDEEKVSKENKKVRATVKSKPLQVVTDSSVDSKDIKSSNILENTPTLKKLKTKVSVTNEDSIKQKSNLRKETKKVVKTSKVDCDNVDGRSGNVEKQIVNTKKTKANLGEKKVPTIKIKEPSIKKTATFVLDVDELEEDPDDEFFAYRPATEEEANMIMAGTFPQTESSEKPDEHTESNLIRDFSFILEQPFYPSTSDILKVDNINWQLGSYLPSVSNILKLTMAAEDAKVLEAWEKRMVAQMGQEGFQRFKSGLFETGKQLHECLRAFLLNRYDLRVNPSIEGHWNSVRWVLEDISDVVSLETPVTNHRLKYRGILDCVARYQGAPCLIEWKTSQRSKPSIEQTFDNPLQVVAYMAAYNQPSMPPSPSEPTNQHHIDASLTINNTKSHTSYNHMEFSPNNETSAEAHLLSNGLLVVAYEDGSKADVHRMGQSECTHYWSLWTQRVHKYWAHVHNWM